MNAWQPVYRFWKVRSDWLGDGGQPVSQQLANNRAEICNRCPYNKESHDFMHMLGKHVAALLKSQIELKATMKLSTPHDSNLRVCEGCGCFLNLKVWTPLKHILATTELSALHPDCWILSESRNP